MTSETIDEAQRRRWLRHDAHLYVRPDAWRFCKPGTPGATPPPGTGYQPPAYVQAAKDRQALEEAKAAQAQADADERAYQRELASIRLELTLLQLSEKVRKAAFRRELAALREANERGYRRVVAYLRSKAGFNPDQPRDDHGRWTDTGAGRHPPAGSDGEAIATDGGINDPGVISDAEPNDAVIAGALLAQNDRSTSSPVDLMEERALGGHAIESHVAKSPEFLMRRVRDEAARAVIEGRDFDGFAAGSFSSLGAANKLVNSALAQNKPIVEMVAGGLLPRARVDAEFDSITGYEAYMKNERSQPYIRDTRGVSVLIVPDSRVVKGYRVDSAFPQNLKR